MIVKLLIACYIICSCIELSKADWDKMKELGYYVRTIKALNKKYRDGEITEDELKERNKICGDGHFGFGDASTQRTEPYLLSDKEETIKMPELDAIFASWYAYHLESIHNYAYCMERIL